MQLADLQHLHDDYSAKTRCLKHPICCAELRGQMTAVNGRLAAISDDEFGAFLARINRNQRSIAYVVGLFGCLQQVAAQEQTCLERGDAATCRSLLAEDVSLFRQICREIRDHYTEGVQVQVIGYGEITTSLTLGDRFTLDATLRPQPYVSPWVYKALPKFPNTGEVRRYEAAFYRYSDLLATTGLDVPAQRLAVMGQDAEGIKVYVVQRRLDSRFIGNVMIRSLAQDAALVLLRRIILKIAGVFAANVPGTSQVPGTWRPDESIRLGVDGQISNWHCADPAPASLPYIDTSTPLYRVNGVEQINPEIFLKNTPSFMRALIRRFFLQDVLDRYYDFRRVTIDLIANLYKEGRADLVAPAVALVNKLLAGELAAFGLAPLTLKEIESYYREDAFIWRFFQTARRLDRFVTERILGRRYPFRLPGKIAR
ncbi:MAG: DUF6206 family protein [Chloroflexi bacterium]|nr:DUF6206 family protein [Chloroflexota bacterium]